MIGPRGWIAVCAPRAERDIPHGCQVARSPSRKARGVVTIIESVASVGASAAVFERGQVAVGVNNSTDFLRSMQAGRGDVVAEPVIQGRVQQLWRVTVTRNEDANAIAQGHVRLQNVPLAQPA